MFPVGYLAL